MNYQDKILNALRLLRNIIFCFILAIPFSTVVVKSAFQTESGVNIDNVEEKVNHSPNSYFNYNNDSISSMSMNSIDYRGLILDRYYEKHNSPLLGYGGYMVQKCDQYNLPSDCTLISAIAFVETELCKQNITAKQYNCWGWGGSGENRVWFSNFYQAIDSISKGLSIGYKSVLENPRVMGITYCGRHCDKWGPGVISEQRKIKELGKELGFNTMGK